MSGQNTFNFTPTDAPFVWGDETPDTYHVPSSDHMAQGGPRYDGLPHSIQSLVNQSIGSDGFGSQDVTFPYNGGAGRVRPAAAAPGLNPPQPEHSYLVGQTSYPIQASAINPSARISEPIPPFHQPDSVTNHNPAQNLIRPIGPNEASQPFLTNGFHHYHKDLGSGTRSNVPAPSTRSGVTATRSRDGVVTPGLGYQYNDNNAIETGGRSAGAATELTYNCFDSLNPQGPGTRFLVPIQPRPNVGWSTREAMSSDMQRIGNASIHATPAHSKKRKYDSNEREDVKNVRKLGACLRCRIYNMKCNVEIPCSNCVKVASTQKIYMQPCTRLNLSDVHTFRAGDGDHGETRTKLPTLQWVRGEPIKKLELQWPFRSNASTSPILTIECQKFQPQKEILTEEFVADGKVRKLELPPWACRDTKVAMTTVEQFMDSCQTLLEEEIQQTLDDNIMALTWNEVLRYRSTYNTPIIKQALRVYAGAMLNSKYCKSMSDNIFGIGEQEHTPHYFEKFPLPPIITYQVQGMIGLIMMKIQTDIIKELKEKIFKRKRIESWYEVFLTIFILLSTIELVYRVQIRYLQAKEGVSKINYTNVSFATQTMFEEWEASAQNLIGHFKCVMNGNLPFSQSWENNSENSRRTALDTQALEFIRKLKGLVNERKDELERLRSAKAPDKFERPLAAICDLFLQDEAKGDDTL